MTKQRAIRLTAIVLALLMPILTATIAWGTEGEALAASGVKYASPDINELMGAGQEPEDISVSAGATYMEKAWYEYVVYSDHAVSSYRISDDSRLLFYDPYTYTNSLVMEVEADAQTAIFDTMSSYSISHTKSTTVSSCVSSTTSRDESIQESGLDETGSNVENSGYSKTVYNHEDATTIDGTIVSTDEYEYKLKVSASETAETSLSTTVTAGTEIDTSALPEFKVIASASETSSISGSVTLNEDWVTDKTTNTTSYNGYKTTTKYSGYDTVEDHTESKTTGWTQLSARVTKSVGSSRSTSTTWSESESTTITKTYAATHFASDGVTPLPWRIVHYRVLMPMKCTLQVKQSGEWVTLNTVYCLLTTVEGTCRSWMDNGQTYYEDWGSGEPVMETQFWAQFMTREGLMEAYKDKLYPSGGEN